MDININNPKYTKVMATKKNTAEKLQELISAKTMESLANSQATETKVETPKAKASKTKETKTPKAKAKKEIKAQATANLVEEVVSKREVKYLYPSDCQDTLARKKYRAQVRAKLHALELAMHRIEDKTSKDFAKAQKEYLAFRKENLKEGVSA